MTLGELVIEKSIKLGEQKQCMQAHLEPSKVMPEGAQVFIKTVLACNYKEEIESSQILLTEANASLAENEKMLPCANKKVQKLLTMVLIAAFSLKCTCRSKWDQ